LIQFFTGKLMEKSDFMNLLIANILENKWKIGDSMKNHFNSLLFHLFESGMFFIHRFIIMANPPAYLSMTTLAALRKEEPCTWTR
jgi:hypothetical protein